MITFDAVTKHYRRGEATTMALAGVSLTVEPGAFVSCMGPSGSGKSTLLHLMGGLDRPSSGHVRLDGVDLGGLDDDALTRLRRTRLGFVFQFFNLLTTLTALENAMLPALLAGVRAAVARARAQDLLAELGLAARLQHRPDQLSGGEMQRVAIARALVNAPLLVLADEPTGNLDSRSGGEILALLRRMTQAQGVTVVMVTHDARAAEVGDRLVRLVDGRVVEDRAVGRAGHAAAAAAGA